jgi:hypothetical protein
MISSEHSQNLWCRTYEQTTEKTSFGQIKDSCLKCGRTAENHARHLELPRFKQEIAIFFNKKLWKFRDWEEARKSGFYLY